eukprot:8544622-Pyramimonas_sp.AAC.1
MAAWAVLGRRKAEMEQKPKSFKHLWTINDFDLFGPSLRTLEDLFEASWAVLEAAWRPSGPSWRHPGLSWAVFEAILDHLGR